MEEDLSMLHPHYFRICENLPKMSSYDITHVLHILKKYAIYYLIPSKSKHLLNLTEAMEKLTRNNSASVVVDVIDVFIELKLDDKVRMHYKSLLRFLNMSSETKFIVLILLEKIAKKYPNFLQNSYRYFYLISLEKTLEFIINLAIVA